MVLMWSGSTLPQMMSDRKRAFFHGHSFTAHPIGCAVALASLEVTLRDDVPDALDRIGKKIENGLRARLRVNDPDHALTSEVRRTGGIVAVDLALPEGSPGGWLADLAPKLRAEAVARGVLLRPLGPVLYAMPPACTTEEQCERIPYATLRLLADGLGCDPTDLLPTEPESTDEQFAN